MTQPVLVDVIAPMPEGWGMCTSCEMLIAQAELDWPPVERGLEYPPEWQADFARLAVVVADLAARYGERILIRLYDPRSLQGLFKAIRHGVRRYPAFVVAGYDKIVGWDEDALERLLLAAGATPGEQVSGA